MAKYEYELRALDGLGLTDVDLDAALAHLLAFVRSHATDAAAALAARRASRMDDREWWEVNAPLLARVFDPSAYPTAARVGTAAGEAHGSAWDAEHAWTFGLDSARRARRLCRAQCRDRRRRWCPHRTRRCRADGRRHPHRHRGGGRRTCRPPETRWIPRSTAAAEPARPITPRTAAESATHPGGARDNTTPDDRTA